MAEPFGAAQVNSVGDGVGAVRFPGVNGQMNVAGAQPGEGGGAAGGGQPCSGPAMSKATTSPANQSAQAAVLDQSSVLRSAVGICRTMIGCPPACRGGGVVQGGSDSGDDLVGGQLARVCSSGAYRSSA